MDRGARSGIEEALDGEVITVDNRFILGVTLRS